MALYDFIDPAFRKLVVRHAQLEKLASGCRWAEGPAYFPGGRYLVWSDIPNNRIMRYDETDDSIGVFRSPSDYANGNTVDRKGRLVSCEHGARRVTRTGHDGRVTVIADKFEGKRLNSPNDVVVHSDSSIWFTDPPYGILVDYEGHRGNSEIGRNLVFRVDGRTGDIRIAADGFDKPNGLAFSPDEKTLYIADSGEPKNMRAFDVTADGRLKNERVFATCTAGRFDGFRVDEDGRIWGSTDDGIHCYLPSGQLIGKILIPEIVSNAVFGGFKRNRLFITATTSLYAIYLLVNGAKTF